MKKKAERVYQDSVGNLSIEDDENDVDGQVTEASEKKIIMFLFFNLQHRRWCEWQHGRRKRLYIAPAFGW